MTNHWLKLAIAAGVLVATSALAAESQQTSSPQPAGSSVPERVGGAIKHGAEVAASAVHRGVTKAASAVERGASATGRAIEKAAQKVGLPASSTASSSSR